MECNMMRQARIRGDVSWFLCCSVPECRGAVSLFWGGVLRACWSCFRCPGCGRGFCDAHKRCLSECFHYRAVEMNIFTAPASEPDTTPW